MQPHPEETYREKNVKRMTATMSWTPARCQCILEYVNREAGCV
jgi:hypothetical protein